MRVALVGAGNVGTAIAYLLSRKDHNVVGVASRSEDSARRAAELLGTDVFPIEDLPATDLILVGASERGIADVDARIGPRLDPGTFVCHFAGVLGPAILTKTLDRGASACAIHPVQAIYSVDAGIDRLPGSAWGVTCSDPGADERMTELIERDLGGVAVLVPAEARPLWHAASVITSNGIAALMALGEHMLSAIGVEDPWRVLGPLAEGTVRNAREGGGGGATLTGPVIRGEEMTIQRHMQSMLDMPGEYADHYRLATMLIVQAAVASGRVDAAEAHWLMQALYR